MILEFSKWLTAAILIFQLPGHIQVHFCTEKNLMLLGYKGKSTQDAICCLTEHTYESLNNKNVCVDVFIVLKKTFNSINHIILLIKLEFYEIRELPLKLLSNYLIKTDSNPFVSKLYALILASLIDLNLTPFFFYCL